MGICPECNENLSCGCSSCDGREKGRLREIWSTEGEGYVKCPKCGYKNCIEYWEDFDFFLATSGGIYKLGSAWEKEQTDIAR